MVIHKGNLKAQVQGRSIELGITVVPWHADLRQQIEAHGGESANAISFAYELTRQFTEDGRVLPTVKSTLGVDVPTRTREIWSVPRIDFSQLVCLLHSIRPFRSPVGNQIKAYNIDALMSFFEKGRFEDTIKMLSVRPSYMEFVECKDSVSLSDGLIDSFIKVGELEFGSYSSSKLRRQARRNYVETKSVILGYTAQEESH